MTLLEAVVYIGIVTKIDKPTLCEKVSKTVILCTNGQNASMENQDKLIVNNQVTVTKASNGELKFSNGLTGRFDSFGWIQFSNGIGVRKLAETEFGFTTAIACKPDDKQKDKVIRCEAYTAPPKK